MKRERKGLGVSINRSPEPEEDKDQYDSHFFHHDTYKEGKLVFVFTYKQELFLQYPRQVSVMQGEQVLEVRIT